MTRPNIEREVTVDQQLYRVRLDPNKGAVVQRILFGIADPPVEYNSPEWHAAVRAAAPTGRNRR